MIEVNEDIIFTDKDKENSVNLMPQYSAAARVINKIFDDVKTDIFKDLIKKTTDEMYDKLNDIVQNSLTSDQEINIQYYICNMVEQTVIALLSGEEWAMKAYPYSDYSKGEKIRKAVAKHGTDKLLLARISDLEKELQRTKENLEFARRF